MPPGLGDVEAVTGTVVILRARADRPLRRAWIEYQPDLKFANLSAFLSPLGASDPAGVLALTMRAASDLRHGTRRYSTPTARRSHPLSACADRPVRAALSRTIPACTTAVPSRCGCGPTRAGRATGPAVASRDVLSVLPEAVLPIEVVADDPIYAVRSVSLSYRTGRNDPPRYLPLYDHRTAPVQAALAPWAGTASLAGPRRSCDQRTSNVGGRWRWRR